MKRWTTSKVRGPTMTVGELIARLQKEDPETPVVGTYEQQILSIDDHQIRLRDEKGLARANIADLIVPQVLVIDVEDWNYFDR